MPRKNLKDSTGRVKFIGHDDWGRPLYKGVKSGVIVVEVNGELYSRNEYESWAEPCFPLGYAPPKSENQNIERSKKENGKTDKSTGER